MLVIRPDRTVIATHGTARLLAFALALHIAGPLLLQLFMVLRRPRRRRPPPRRCRLR